MSILCHAKSTPPAMMIAAAAQQDMVCRVIGACRREEALDLEFREANLGRLG